MDYRVSSSWFIALLAGVMSLQTSSCGDSGGAPPPDEMGLSGIDQQASDSFASDADQAAPDGARLPDGMLPPDGPALPDGAGSPDLVAGALTGKCRACPKCMQNQLCLGGSLYSQFAPTCLDRCATTDDCGKGFRCAVLFGEANLPVCVSPTVPELCPGEMVPQGWHCDLAPVGCVDAQTIAIAFNQPVNAVCGWEHVRCANGCDPGKGPLDAMCK